MVDAAARAEVRYDPVRRRLCWVQRGFWAMDDVAALVTKMRLAVAPLGPPPYRIDSLCDASDFPVQSREVADALGEIGRMTAAMRTGRFAIVVASMTNKLQVQRTMLSNARAFLTLEEAEAWLDQPDESAA